MPNLRICAYAGLLRCEGADVWAQTCHNCRFAVRGTWKLKCNQ